MPGAFYGISLRDSSGEIGKTDWNVGDLTAITLPTALTQMGDLEAAISNIVIGVTAATRWGDSDIVSNGMPSDPTAQRGVKWNVLIEDNVTHYKTTNYLPTADLSLLEAKPGGGFYEDLDITVNPGLEFKTSLEALVKYPGTGNAITVLRVYYAD